MLSLTSDIRTVYHKWPARLKLAGLCAATVSMSFLSSLSASLAACAMVGGLYAVCGIPFVKQGIRMLRPLWVFVVVVAFWHLATASLAEGATTVAKLVAAVALANLVTMTTRLDDLIAAIEPLFHPLARFGLNPRIFALSVALVVRFIPVLAHKGGQLVEAWRARSHRRPGWRIITPLALIALDDAEHIAEALRARGGAAPDT